MPSFELMFEEDEDVLEVTFDSYDEQFTRTVSLNDTILVYLNPDYSCVTGLTFYNYRQLLQISETHLDGLRPLPEADARRVLNMLSAQPASLFLEILDPGDLRALVRAPRLEDLLAG